MLVTNIYKEVSGKVLWTVSLCMCLRSNLFRDKKQTKQNHLNTLVQTEEYDMLKP